MSSLTITFVLATVVVTRVMNGFMTLVVKVWRGLTKNVDIIQRCCKWLKGPQQPENQPNPQRLKFEVSLQASPGVHVLGLNFNSGWISKFQI